jgi:hypothetical protein
VAVSGDCEGSYTFPNGEPKDNSSGLPVIELPHLWVGSCGVQRVDEVRATPLSHRTTRCWSTQRGLACRQTREPREKNHVSPL